MGVQAQRKARTVAKQPIERFIEGKKNSYQTRTERLLWLEDKVRKYTAEADELRDELKREAKKNASLESLRLDLEAKQLGLLDAQARMANLSAEDVPAAIDGIVAIRAEIESVEDEIRSLYYAK